MIKAASLFESYNMAVEKGYNCIFDNNENIETSVRRELKEELGLDFDFTESRPYFTMNFQKSQEVSTFFRLLTFFFYTFSIFSIFLKKMKKSY